MDWLVMTKKFNNWPRISLGCVLRMQKCSQLENLLSYCVLRSKLRRSVWALIENWSYKRAYYSMLKFCKDNKSLIVYKKISVTRLASQTIQTKRSHSMSLSLNFFYLSKNWSFPRCSPATAQMSNNHTNRCARQTGEQANWVFLLTPIDILLQQAT